MAYRNIHETFWTDPKIKELKPLDRYLFLYLITNPHGHFTGIYYIPKPLIVMETGLPDRGIDRGIDTLVMMDLIKYDPDLNIIWILKMLKYQSCNKNYNEKQLKGIANHIETLHNSTLIKDFLDFNKNLNIPYEYKNDTPMNRGMVTPPYTDTDTDSYPVSDTGKKKTKIPYKEIISYLNERLDTQYQHSTSKTRELIKARFQEGFTFNDFKVVIDKKIGSWGNDSKMSLFLRPETLFGNKFESYLNEREINPFQSKHIGAVEWLKEKEAKIAGER